MTNEAFYQEIRERIKDFLPEQYQDAQVIVREFEISGIKRHGMGIVRDGLAKIPALDLHFFVKEMQDGKTAEEVLKNLADSYVELCDNPPATRSVAMGKEKFMASLHVSVIHFESHREILALAPYLRVNDLAVVPMFLTPEGESIPLSLENMSQMGESPDWVLAMAMKNHAKVLPPVLLKLPEKEGEKPETKNWLLTGEKLDTSTAYLLTNQRQEYGAAVMADKAVLEQISQRFEGSFYILPESIHELMVVPQASGADPKVLKMLAENLARIRDPKGFLSKNVYRYDADRKEVEMFDGKLHREKVKSCASRAER